MKHRVESTGQQRLNEGVPAASSVLRGFALDFPFFLIFSPPAASSFWRRAIFFICTINDLADHCWLMKCTTTTTTTTTQGYF